VVEWFPLYIGTFLMSSEIDPFFFGYEGAATDTPRAQQPRYL